MDTKCTRNKRSKPLLRLSEYRGYFYEENYMNQYKTKPIRQLELLEEEVEMKKQPAKRVNIDSLKLAKESSLLYKNRCVRSRDDGYQLLKQFSG